MMILNLAQNTLLKLLKECLNKMTIEQIIDNNVPLNQIPKSIAKKSDYNYIRNNGVEYEWKCRNEKKKKERDNVKM